MGNFNSGRSTNRRTTTDMRRLDVRALHKAGMLLNGDLNKWRWWRAEGITLHEAQIAAHVDHIAITHACTRVAGEQASYRIRIEHTACHLGGHRVWWRCPATACGRRVAVLYGCNGTIFACRHCHRLNYDSQRKSKSDRQFMRVEKLRHRLGWQRGIANGHQGKPLHMRWHSYWRLLAEHDRLERAILGAMAQRFAPPLRLA